MAEPYSAVFEKLYPPVVRTTMVLYRRHDFQFPGLHFGAEDSADAAH